ncbi:MAG: Kiwa anti-phage protein KwaB-like domain-containing protein [Clostridium perfringens]
MILKKDDMNLMFFKKFISSIYLKSKMKLLWLEGRMERLDKDIISIDDKFDCVGFSNNLLVISKPAFEQIFDYKDEYTKKANENIEHMNKLSIIKNIELLAMECEKVTIKKKLAKIKKDQIEWFKDQIENNFNRVEHIIDKAGLDIQVIEGELNINDVSELIHLIQNDYLKSEIDDENYIADSKRPIKQ